MRTRHYICILACAFVIPSCSHSQHDHGFGFYGKNGCIKNDALKLKDGYFYHEKTIWGNYYIPFVEGHYHTAEGDTSHHKNLHMKCDAGLVEIWNKTIDSLKDSLNEDYQETWLQVGICEEDEPTRSYPLFGRKYFLGGALMYNCKQIYPLGSSCEKDNTTDCK